jgi:hypothetical protein
MVNHPGSGLLSTGFQQVSDRPFFISEWMSLIPNEWTAESAPLIAAYGLGLQGWDASFAFAMDYDHFTPTVQSGHGVYNVTSPTQLALYPALSAMVYRGDVKEGASIANRTVSLSELQKGRLPFFEKVEQEADVKSLQAAVPPEALAKGKVVLSFSGNTKGGKAPALPWGDGATATITSNTGQLQWHYKDSGYVAIQTKGTQGVIGFAQNRPLTFPDITLQIANPFAVVFVTSLEPNKDVASAKRLLVTTMARARNTGMQYTEDKKRLLNVGEAPVLLEPVAGTVRFQNAIGLRVYVLDHSGNRTGAEVPVTNGTIELDGAQYKAIYYEVVRP